MVPQQKQSWFVLAVLAAAALAVAGLIPLLGKGAWGGLGILGLLGLTPWLFRRSEQPGEVAFDERDKTIHGKAFRIGAVASYEFVVLMLMGTWFLYMLQGRKTISIQYLPLIVAGACIALLVTQAVATLVLYRREDSHGEE